MRMKPRSLLILIALFAMPWPAFSQGNQVLGTLPADAKKDNVNPLDTAIVYKPERLRSSISLEYLKPFLVNAGSLSSDLLNLDVSIAVSRSSLIKIYVPFCRLSDIHSSEEGIGNLYLGLESVIDEKSRFNFGVFAPTMNDKNVSLILTSSLVNFYQLMKYLPNTLTFALDYNFKAPISKLLFGFLAIGPRVFIPTKGSDDSFIYAHYYGGLGIGNENCEGTIDLRGLAYVAGKADPDFDERFFNYINVGAKYKGHNFQPELYFSLPLHHEIKHIESGILGLRIAFMF